MSDVTTKATRTIMLQAYLAVSPSRPYWSGVEFSAINGWRDYQWWDGSRCIRDPRLTDQFGSWSFVSHEAAMEVLAELLERGQKHHLRVVQIETVTVQEVLGGAMIDNGTVVVSPTGERPVFMGKPVPRLVEETPPLALPEAWSV